MKILEFKRSRIGIIMEFSGVPNGFPNQGHASNGVEGFKLGPKQDSLMRND
jgi:hypothetical protein